MMQLDGFLRRTGSAASKESSTISRSTLDMVTRLGLKRRKIRKVVVGLTCAVAGLQVIILLLLFLSYVAGPDSAISSIEVPDVIMGHFGTGGSSRISELAASIAEDISALMPWLIAATIFTGIVIAMATRSHTPIILALAIPFVSTMLSPILDAMDQSPISERSAFVKAVEGLHADKVLKALTAKGLEDGPARDYLLSQLAVKIAMTSDDPAESLKKGSASSATAKAWVMQAATHSDEYEPDPQRLYAVETAILGKATSAPAQQYVQERELRQSTLRGSSWILTLVMMLLLTVTIGTAILQRLISSRVNRLHQIIAPYI